MENECDCIALEAQCRKSRANCNGKVNLDYENDAVLCELDAGCETVMYVEACNFKMAMNNERFKQ